MVFVETRGSEWEEHVSTLSVNKQRAFCSAVKTTLAFFSPFLSGIRDVGRTVHDDAEIKTEKGVTVAVEEVPVLCAYGWKPSL